MLPAAFIHIKRDDSSPSTYSNGGLFKLTWFSSECSHSVWNVLQIRDILMLLRWAHPCAFCHLNASPVCVVQSGYELSLCRSKIGTLSCSNGSRNTETTVWVRQTHWNLSVSHKRWSGFIMIVPNALKGDVQWIVFTGLHKLKENVEVTNCSSHLEIATLVLSQFNPVFSWLWGDNLYLFQLSTVFFHN